MREDEGVGLSRYKLFDCTHIRIPTPTSVGIEMLIEQAILQAATTGVSTENVLAKLIENKEIVEQVQEQVGQNLAFQRRTIDDEIRLAREGRLRQLDESSARARASTSQKYDSSIENVKKNLEAQTAQRNEAQQNYAHSRRKLDDLRSDIDRTYAGICGSELADFYYGLGSEIMYGSNDGVTYDTPKSKTSDDQNTKHKTTDSGKLEEKLDETVPLDTEKTLDERVNTIDESSDSTNSKEHSVDSTKKWEKKYFPTFAKVASTLLPDKLVDSYKLWRGYK